MFEIATQADYENLGEQDFSRTAVYFESMDYIDYVRRDEITVSDRIDQYLTLIWNRDQTEVIGFRLKGIKNFFLRELKPYLDLTDEDFISVRDLFIVLVQYLGDELHSQEERRKAYKSASEMASNDKVKVTLPRAA